MNWAFVLADSLATILLVIHIVSLATTLSVKLENNGCATG